ncbi:GNAT family N-acetyltransferase [Actinopolymorpha sp. B9G3]|uniref:GNAT family N-acetyltransferase n=1 Tax=Actinopolymorpha sp. B9G3 TaxID=3158970 RepID=UPI0032D8EF07
MPELVAPTTRVHASFLQAMTEFHAEGRGRGSDNSMIGRETRAYAATWETPEGFAAYVETLVAAAREDTPRPDGLVPATSLWWVDGSTYLGRLAIRHRLTPFLLEQGGHIGYDVRPTARRRGHATAMLRAALPIANGLGLASVLVTCDTDNVASRKVIESAGGVLEDQRLDKLRFWVPTS